jgi:hypothetical protein
MKFNAGSGGGTKNPHEVFLKDGDRITGVLRGEPFEFERAFKAGEKAKFRFRINIVTLVNGQLESKIISNGWKLYRQLKELSEGGWNLEECYTTISRQGSSPTNTVYSATPSPKPVDPATLAKVAAVKLKDLKEGLEGHGNASAPSADPGSFNQEDSPF